MTTDAREEPRADVDAAFLRRGETGSTFRDDPDLTDRRSWADAIRLAAALGLPFGVIPAGLLLEFAPQLGFLWPALWSFAGVFLLFTLLGRVRHRAVAWVTAAATSGLLIVVAVAATLWTLTQSIPAAG